MEPVPVRPLSQHAGADYDADEVEFLRAVTRYQREWKRKFLTFVDVLRIARSLGYRKVESP